MPVLMLTGQDRIIDKIAGLDAGGTLPDGRTHLNVYLSETCHPGAFHQFYYMAQSERIYNAYGTSWQRTMQPNVTDLVCIDSNTEVCCILPGKGCLDDAGGTSRNVYVWGCHE